jgi:hypothetical protein
MDAKLMTEFSSQGPLINEDFFSRSPAGNHGIKRPAIKIIAGIFFIFRELFFEYNPSEIGFVPVE